MNTVACFRVATVQKFRMLGAMGYTINIVGEQHYQSAIAACEEGEVVLIAHEIGNPHDEEALVVINDETGEKLGYIPRESFLRRVIFQDNRSVEAEIYTIFNRKGFLELNIHVEILDENADEAVPQVQYVAPWQPLQPDASEDEPDKEPGDGFAIFGIVGSVFAAALILFLLMR